jgi:alpha-N-arabinofuranosidase
LGDALFSASFFNACLRHAEDVGMANIAPLVNTRGPLRVHPNGIVKRTHFHTMSMYANLLDSRVVDAKIESTLLQHEGESIPAIDVVVTQDNDGKNWSIAMVNRHPSLDGECTISINGKLLEGNFNATILSGDSPEAYNSIENPDRVFPESTALKFEKGVTMLAPHSLTILKVSGI